MKRKLAQLATKITNFREDRFWKKKKQVAMATVDGKRLTEIFDVLLNNQIKYTRCGEPYDRETQEVLFDTTVRTLHRLRSTFDIVGVQPMTGASALTFRLEYTAGKDKTGSLAIVKSTVTAKSRKLNSRLPIQEIQDFRIQGLSPDDVKNEIVESLADAVSLDITGDILEKLLALNIETREFGLETLSSENAAMAEINRATTKIAHATRRGAGNFIITSPLGVAALQQFLKSFWTPVDAPADRALQQVAFVGERDVRVYQTVCPKFTSDTGFDVLVGYKGSSDTDAGFFYCPYVTLILSSMMIDPVTFNPAIPLLTRNGCAINARGVEDSYGVEFDAESLAKAGNYFVKLRFNYLKEKAVA